MPDPIPAHLLFLTDPEPRKAVLNLQVAGQEIQRFEVNRDQLFALNAKSADILLKDHK
jgi:hypothetical protein